MGHKKFAALLLAAVLAGAAVPMPDGTVSVSAASQAMAANPVISRGVPAFSDGGNASYGNDDAYWTAWESSAPDYLAYDLSGVPAAKRKKVIAVWYNDSTYDALGDYVTKQAEPIDYVIEVNSAAGGSLPENGWTAAETVETNNLSSRQHLIDLQGCNWIRIRVTKAESGKVKLNFDIHDASQGVQDSWIFFGDSITAGGMVNQWGTSYAAHIHALDADFFPVAQNGGIGGISSPHGKASIDSWLKGSPVKYVSIAYGTNDCWGNPNNADAYYSNTKYMIDAVLKLGKVPVLPTIPFSTNEDVGDNVGYYNAKIRQLYSEYGDKLVQGPDFEVFFTEHPEYLGGDGVHPSSDGYEAMRQLWAETMYANVYSSQTAAVGAETLTGDVNTDGKCDAADAELLRDWLINKAKLNAVQAAAADLDGNSKLNAADLTLLKRLLLQDSTAQESKSAVYNAEDHTKLIGRTLTKNGVTWLVQSGSAAECTVTGTKASVTIAGDGSVRSDEKYRPRYGVYVDGELIKDVVMSETEQTVELFSGTKQRTATVKVMHLSEANNGAIGVKQFDVTSSSANPVKPTAKKDLSVEFIGDSITCAYGVGADNQYEGFSTGTEDFSKSYAYLTAELIQADYSAVSYSGFGILSGYTSDGSLNADMLVPPVYGNVAKSADYAVPWDFASHPSDVVVLNLGTNDDSYASKDLETRGAAYQAEYVRFLAQIRKCNPDAVIICTLGIMGCEELYPYIEAAVIEFGDSKVTCYQSPTQNIAGDGIGADWHPSPKTHQINAYLLADKICTALGREYSRVGVDFAADGEYGADIDDTNGANAWPYYAEWNKSLNLNITAGGASPADITAYVRGLDLPAGSYALSFDVKGAENIEFPFAVRDAAHEYCKGTASGTSGTAEFTMKSAANSCEIVFLLGEIGSANLTFENVKLYKTA